MISRNKLGVINNSCQGSFKRILTVCSAGCLRSPTAAHILASEPYNFNTRCAGLSKEYAITLVTEELLVWADEIFVMDENMGEEVIKMMKNIGLTKLKLVYNLNIEDDYNYRDPELVKIMNGIFSKIYLNNA